MRDVADARTAATPAILSGDDRSGASPSFRPDLCRLLRLARTCSIHRVWRLEYLVGDRASVGKISIVLKQGDAKHGDVNAGIVTFLVGSANLVADETLVLVQTGVTMMWTKTKIALSTLLVVGFASTALAGETPKSKKIGDRAQTVQRSAGSAAFGYIGPRRSLDRFGVPSTRDFSIRSQH